MSKKILKHNYEHIVLKGDFNGTVSNIIDRSMSKSKKKLNPKIGELLKVFFDLTENLGIMDVW